MIARILICLFVISTPIFAQIDVQLPNISSGRLIAGEHYPLIYTGDGLIKGSTNTLSTAWMQVGFAADADEDANRNVGIFNPEVFTVGVKLSCYGSGDSAGISAAHFECAYDIDLQPFWNADSSNNFIELDCYSHEQYGVWRFEAIDDTARQWLFPIRMLIGGYIRLVFETDVVDTSQVNWCLICEH
ncbi:MAG: hypothetical protein HQ568_07320 [Calditrichaeota bacterium]|nr:hypothetical protein [Calditrichota bacterium]